jgi:hypothetical protein
MSETGDIFVDFAATWKMGFGVIVFVSTLFPAMIPMICTSKLYVGGSNDIKDFFSLKIATAFSGGVFITICLIHLIPEVSLTIFTQGIWRLLGIP